MTYLDYLNKLLLCGSSGGGSYPEPTGTKNITQNGNNIDVKDYAAANVNVPNSYTAQDEGKVVSDGALVSQTTKNITQNGTFDTTLNDEVVVNVPSQTPTLITKSITQNGTYNAQSDNADGYSEVTVNVSGGSQTVEAVLIAGTLSGSYTNSEVTQVKARMFEDSSVSAIDFPNCTYVSNYAFKNARSLQRLNLPRLFSIGLAEAFTYDGYSLGDNQFLEINLPLVKRFPSGCFRYAKLKNIVLNSATSIDAYSFANCQYLESIDLAVKNASPTISNNAFNGDTLLSTLILRLTKTGSLWSLENTTAFFGTPFDLGGGYIYVPSAKIDDYKAANNWSNYASRFRALEDYTADGTTTGALDPNKI